MKKMRTEEGKKEKIKKINQFKSQVKPATMPKTFKRFVPLSIHISDVILDDGKLDPYKILNFQVRLNVEEVQNLTQPGSTKEQIAQELANTIVEQFRTVEFWPKETAKKIKLETDAGAESGEFGYYQLA